MKTNKEALDVLIAEFNHFSNAGNLRASTALVPAMLNVLVDMISGGVDGKISASEEITLDTVLAPAAITPIDVLVDPVVPVEYVAPAEVPAPVVVEAAPAAVAPTVAEVVAAEVSPAPTPVETPVAVATETPDETPAESDEGKGRKKGK